MEKYCANCGNELHNGACFCAKCGAAVNRAAANPVPAAQPKTVPQPQPQTVPQPVIMAQLQISNPPAAPAKRNRGQGALCFVLSVLLVIQITLVALFGWPGFVVNKTADADVITGVSSIKPVSSDYKTEPETMNISYENYRAEFDSGIVVDFGFGQGCLQEVERLSVRTLGEKSDGEYEAVLYDFDLGETDSFPQLVAITVPYDASWGKNVFVQHYNDKTHEWEIIWSEVNEAGSITFWTDHFSTFAAFRAKVENGGGGDGPLFYTMDKEPGMTSKCYLDYYVLAKQLRDSNVSIQTLITGNADTFGTESMLNIINNTSTFGSYTLSAADFISEATGGIAKFGRLTDAIGKAGIVMTAGKVMLQAYRTGNLGKTLADNGNDIAQIILTGVGTAVGGTTATVLGAASLCLYVYNVTSNVKDHVDLLGYEDTTEYAYRIFTNNYVTYIMKEGRCSFKYGATQYRMYDQTWQSTENLLSTNDIGQGKWMTVFDYICKKYEKEPERIFPAIENLINDYCTVFWRIQGNKTFQEFLDNTRAGMLSLKKLADVYKAPSKTEQDMYTTRFKAELTAWLKPLVDKYAEKAYVQTLTLALQNALQLQHELNQTISFTLVDERHKDFSDSPYAAYPISIRQFKFNKDWWKFTKENKHTISCSRFIFLSAGMPKYVDIKKEGDELQTITMRITDPHTYIMLESGEFPTFDELAGYYENGTIVLSAVEMDGGLLSFLEEIGAEITAGDSVGTSNSQAFYINKKGNNTGTIESEDFSGTAEYDPNSGKMRVKLSDKDGKTVKGELSCLYNASKNGVTVSGTLSGSVILVASFSLTLKGSKSLTGY